ncbi:MAG: 3-oxoacyl-[acyl-carrier-protein] synthase III C-terminal domain-containing protein, partial [Thermomicrobiales bacterium]
LVEAEEAGRLSEGANIVFVAFGGGLAWAASVVRWGIAGVARMTESRAEAQFASAR